MSELTEVKQSTSKVTFDLPEERSDKGFCPVQLRKGKRTGEICGEPTFGTSKCSAHMAADKRKTGTSNPFKKLLQEGPPQPEVPFTIKEDETLDEIEEDNNEEIFVPYPQSSNLGPEDSDELEEITISLKNVKFLQFKIIRRRA